MEWIVIPISLLIAAVSTALAGRALREPEEPPAPPCEHPWYIDGRCIVCGTPR